MAAREGNARAGSVRRGRRAALLASLGLVAVLLGGLIASREKIIKAWYVHRLASLDKDVVSGAIEALRQFRTRWAATALVEHLRIRCTTRDTRSRHEVLMALLDIEGPTFPELVRSAPGWDASEQVSLLRSLTTSGNLFSADPFVRVVECLARSDLVRARYVAVTHLGELGAAARDGLPVVLAALRDGDASVRQAAIGALTREPNNPGIVPVSDVRAVTVPALVKALEDEDAAVRVQAASAFRWLRELGAGGVQALWKALKSEDHALVQAAYFSLLAVDVEGSRPIRWLEDIITNEDFDVRRIGQEAIRDPERSREIVAHWLVGRLDELTGESDRWWSAQRAREVGVVSLPYFLKALSSPNATTRQLAASNLGFLGFDATGALPQLAALSRDDADPAVRAAATEAVAMIEGKP